MRWEAGAASAMHASVREGRQKRRACRERTSTCPATEGISCHLYPEPHAAITQFSEMMPSTARHSDGSIRP
jgi:hypothetical protein